MRVLLGISGGIAAYKTPDLVRRLRERDHEVRCIVSDQAQRLVAKDALIAVSGAAVADSMWPGDGSMPHIDLARWAELLLIAPATANTMAKLALGLADDLLSTTYLALEPDRRVVLVPAMNTVMWNKAIVSQHVATLRDRGHQIIDPIPGELACGEQGVGAMAQPEHIAELLA